ncbi:MAG: PilZ domain-containing protein [Desulfomonile sp.]|nr:PilZ domain-containing protein [Desulfomonile sp.]
MPTKRTIKAKDIVTDIRSGMTDSELMDKYQLSAKGLESLFKKILDAKIMTVSEIYGRISLRDDTVGLENLRLTPRNYLAFSVPILDAANVENEGAVVDISESGLQVSGIEATAGETKDFLIRADELQDIYPFGFQAICRWTRKEPDGTPVAGFEITDIPEGSLHELRKLIRSLTLGG